MQRETLGVAGGMAPGAAGRGVRTLACLLAVGAGLAISSSAMAGWTATVLGRGEGRGVSAGGQVVGRGYYPGGNQLATHWESNGTATQLDQLGNGSANAFGVNNSGQAVGNDSFVGEGRRAVRWEADRTATRLGSMGGTSFSLARAVNDSSVAVGYANFNSSSHPTNPGTHPLGRQGHFATRWEANGQMSVLGWQVDAGPSDVRDMLGSYAQGINASGQSVGLASVNGLYAQMAVRWEADGRAILLGAEDGFSSAQAINDLGEVVGWSEYESGTFATQWSANGDRTRLDSAGMLESIATGVNNRGQAVGHGYMMGSNEYEAVLWEADGSVTNLHALVSGLGFFDTRANGTWSDANFTYVTGRGVYNRNGQFGEEAILWTFTNQLQAIPLPTSTGLAGLGLGLIALRRRRAGA